MGRGEMRIFFLMQEGKSGIREGQGSRGRCLEWVRHGMIGGGPPHLLHHPRMSGGAMHALPRPGTELEVPPPPIRLPPRPLTSAVRVAGPTKREMRGPRYPCPLHMECGAGGVASFLKSPSGLTLEGSTE
ncbi:hypothetical protein H6P81_000968 [Aristolochia fimbriata]|uniref:Uncharacterized protein n=1 Tax=Aristolochia fimbriata TaxID=158543 RepID=A0AAV7F879_ARIFI|nr:hypothetical protein H6P81_000968 [Aristolochia fimbriata]